MSASKAAKAIGLPSLKYVCDHANVKRSTIYNWYKRNRPLFDAVINGVPRPIKSRIIEIRCKPNQLITAKQLKEVINVENRV